MKNIFKLLFSFLRTRLLTIILIVLTWIISAVVYFAYGLASEPIRYAMLLGITVFLPIAIIDFLHFVHKHNSLQQIKENLDVTLLEMPPALNTLERDYQEIANTLYNEKANIISTENIKAKETKEYYTMWVHQIKTPIAAMQLLLANTPQNAQISAELFQVEQYADMALNYARLENIHNDLEIKEYPLDEIIGKALKKYSRLFILKKTNLNFSGTGVTVLTDEKWLEFVLEQLLSNALKYTRSGTISIGMDPEKEKNLVISDTGIGIRGEDLPRVFEKGFTGYNGRLNKKSSGIGLYMCQKVLKNLSHQITITSTPQKGTQVSINLSSIRLEVE